MSAVQGVVGGKFSDSVSIENLFHSDDIHRAFREFLVQQNQKIFFLRIEQDHQTSVMELEVKTAQNITRQVKLSINDDNLSPHAIKSATAINLNDTISVLQVVLMFTSSQNYPHYTLELQNNSQLMLCCRKKLPTLELRDFAELITALADTADRLEETMFPPGSGKLT